MGCFGSVSLNAVQRFNQQPEEGDFQTHLHANVIILFQSEGRLADMINHRGLCLLGFCFIIIIIIIFFFLPLVHIRACDFRIELSSPGIAKFSTVAFLIEKNLPSKSQLRKKKISQNFTDPALEQKFVRI